MSLTADAAIDDPLAFTELHLVFRNPENRVREGRFRITLPSGATVSRFAMRIGDRWQEGEVVEQQAARVAYEDFLHHRQDPALLEAEAGNEFSARVFPDPGGGDKEIVISYAQELTRADEPYRLPLRGLPRVGTLAIRAVAGAGKAETRLERRDVTPDRDFELAAQGPGRAARAARRQPGGGARRPARPRRRRARRSASCTSWSTPAPRARSASPTRRRAVERLLGELRGNGDPSVTVAAFDQDVVPMFAGRASGAVGVVGKRILARGALGASDLDRALASLAATIKPGQGRTPRPRASCW